MLFNKPVDYYEMSNLNATIAYFWSSIKRNQVFMHINARSLSNNFDSIITELSLTETNVDTPTIIAITVTCQIVTASQFQDMLAS